MRGLSLLVPLLLAFASHADERFLHSIPLRLDPALDLSRAQALQAAVAGDPTHTRRLQPYASVDAAAPAPFRSASFVIDFDEPAVEALRSELVAQYGESPSVEQLVRFTHDFVSDKGLDRGFELASQVASHASGDCTEHAVLLTALARATGRPARVVLGVALLREQAGVAAYGHAWSELYDAGRWRVGEATGLGADSVLGYVAVAALPDESPGYSLPLVEAFAAPWFKGITLAPLPGDA